MATFLQHAGMNGAWLRWLYRVMALAAVASVVLSLGRFGFQVMEAREVSQEASPVAAPKEAPDMRSAAQAAWFGEGGDAVEISGGGGELELKGVSKSADPALAGAFIATRGGEDVYYHLGDRLPGNHGTLEEIFSDHVTLRTGSEIRVLNFSDAPPEAAGESEPVVEAAPQEGVKAQTLALAQEFGRDAEGVLKQAGLSAVVKGNPAGYHYNGEDSSGVLAGMGLQKDDVILTVNSLSVGNVAEDAQVLPNFAGMPSLTLRVQRGDKEMVIEYHMP